MMLGDLSIEWSMIFAILALMGGFVVGVAIMYVTALLVPA